MFTEEPQRGCFYSFSPFFCLRRSDDSVALRYFQRGERDIKRAPTQKPVLTVPWFCRAAVGSDERTSLREELLHRRHAEKHGEQRARLLPGIQPETRR